MANHFPGVPAGLQLASVAYQVTIGDAGQIGAASPLTFDGAQTAVTTPTGSGWPDLQFTATFTFTAPGDPGGFDQDTAEARLNTVAASLAQAVAATTGEDPAAVQALIAVTRRFTYTDPAGSVLTVPA